MMRSLTLGRIHDISIKVHPTFGLVVLWVFYRWGVNGNTGSLIFGLILVALVFACVVIHELGHSFMAMQYRIQVHDITLLPVGGMARIEQVPTRPRSEILIALAGPAMNVAIALALLPLLLLFCVVRGVDSPGALVAYLNHVSPGGLLVYLFFTNVMLVLFNMLPAFPMDGGRVLRASLSAAFGRDRGTRIAVWVGQGLAVALGLFGLWLGDYLLPLVSLVVIVVARAEGRTVRLESAMRRLRVGQFALWDMGGISPRQPLTYALRGGPRDLAVTEGGRVIGMVWRHQLLQEMHRGTAGRTVGDVMDRNVVTADVDDSVYDVQQQMNRLHRWAIPITEGGLYRGIFTADRFVHVYRQLSPHPLRGRVATGFVETITYAVRAWIR